MCLCHSAPYNFNINYKYDNVYSIAIKPGVCGVQCGVILCRLVVRMYRITSVGLHIFRMIY